MPVLNIFNVAESALNAPFTPGLSETLRLPLLLSLLNKVRRQTGEKMFVTSLSWWRSCSLRHSSHVFVFVCASGFASLENLLWWGTKDHFGPGIFVCLLVFVCAQLCTVYVQLCVCPVRSPVGIHVCMDFSVFIPQRFKVNEFYASPSIMFAFSNIPADQDP